MCLAFWANQDHMRMAGDINTRFPVIILKIKEQWLE
jgi:hypothetical protein